MKLNLIINCAFCIVNCALLISCASNRPVATTHTERIEERVMPIPVGADTIEITLCRDTRSECPDGTQNIKTCLLGRDFAQQKQDHYVKEKSSYVFLSKKPTSTASPNLWETTHSEGVNSVLSVNQRSLSLWRKNSVSSVRDKNNSVRNKNSSVRDKNNSVREKESSVRNNNSVRISSTRGINISRHETDTTNTLRITLRPDTVFVPYTNHIRSDTIVVPDRICKTKLQKTQTANVLLILILIAIFIYSLRS